jgi:fructose-specific phosphotransferase system IIC component
VVPTLLTALAMAAGVAMWLREISKVLPDALALASSVLVGALVYGALAMLVNADLVRSLLGGMRSMLRKEQTSAP